MAYAQMESPQANVRTNILFILADDMHVRAFGAAGSPEARTPNLDWLAASGMHFTQCHVSDPLSSVVRACIHTGRLAPGDGEHAVAHQIDDSSPRIGELLSMRGYQTAFVGQWAHKGRPSDHGFVHTSNVFLGGMHGYDCIPVVQGHDDDPREVRKHPTEVFTDGAIELLRKPMENPFALFLWYTAPHDPRVAPAGLEDLYPSRGISLPPNFKPAPEVDCGLSGTRDEKLLARPLDPDAIKSETSRYYAQITHMDAQIGRVLHLLRDTDQLANTLIIFTSDSGLCLGAHGLLGKQNMYEESVRVPLVVAGPGVMRGARCHALVDVMDLMPTMCDVAGGVIPRAVQGRTLTPLLCGKRDRLRNAAFCRYRDVFRMVKTTSHKLIVNLKTGREEFYNLETDPHELTDLSSSPAHAGLREECRQLLAEWRKDIRDTGSEGPSPESPARIWNMSASRQNPARR